MNQSRIIKHYIFLIATFLMLQGNTVAQILHTENFAVILDTTKNYKGTIIPDFKYQNQKEDLLEFENTANFSYRFKKNAITLANKIELSRYGKTTLLSGGFVYLEYRRMLKNRFVLEPYAQIQWSDARGLETKYAGGANLRYKIIYTEKVGLFVGTGPFYEYEKWNYNGVKDVLLPLDLSKIERENTKLGTYLSFKWFTGRKIDLDISIYHQSRFDQIFSSPRLASSSSITYKFTKNIGLILRYQNIFDPNPIVPIDKLYNRVMFTIQLSF